MPRSTAAASLALALHLALAACGPPPPPLLPVVEVERYCTALIACGLVRATGNTLASCVANRRQRDYFRGFGLSFEEGRSIDCFLQQPTCAAAVACASRMHDATYCMLRPGASCDGNVRVDCTDPAEVRTEDCVRLNMTCRAGAAPSTAFCTTGRMCGADAARCDGTAALIRCRGGLEAREACELVQAGSVCAMTPTGASCIPPNAPACATPFAGRCEPMNVAVGCGSSGRETRAACPANTACMVTAAGAACVPNSTTCSDGENDTCMGGSVQYCLDGQRVTVACGTVGTTTCGMGMAGNVVCQ